MAAQEQARRRTTITRHLLALAAAGLLLLALPAPVPADGLIDALVTRFAQSDFVFPRGNSDVPFLPLAWFSATEYNRASFTHPDNSASDVDYRQSNLSEGALVPVPVTSRDAVVVGEWVSATQLREIDADKTLNVLSVSVPLGWARQVNHDWQAAAFIAPLGQTDHQSSWYWQTLGGVFARYLRNDDLAWIFGAYFEQSSLEHFYTPYVGATWIINPHWTLGLVLPWPGINYAPNPDLQFRFGLAPSSSSWSAESLDTSAGATRPRINFDSYNLGLSAERRVYGNLWLGIEAGWSGLRGLTIVGGRYDSLETQLNGTGFVMLMLNFRPALPGTP